MGVQMQKTRDSIFDIMKGIAIISVVVIHSCPPWQLYHLLSFFHVPLFFVISGYFSKEKRFSEVFLNRVTKLLIPLVFTSLVMLLVVSLLDAVCGTHSIDVAVKSLLLGTASWTMPPGEVYILSAGPLWFLWALVFVSVYWSFFQRVNNELLRGVLVLVFAMAANLSKSYFTLPFSIQASFGALGFFYAGFLVKKYGLLENVLGKKISIVCLIAFVYCVGFSNIDVNLCAYGALYVPEVLAVLAVFFALHAIVTKYRTESRLWSLLNFVGRYSLVAFCVHSIDQNIFVYWLPYKIWASFEGDFQTNCAILLRIMLVIFTTWLVSKNKFLCKKVFFIE